MILKEWKLTIMALIPSNCWKIMKITAMMSCGLYFLLHKLATENERSQNICCNCYLSENSAGRAPLSSTATRAFGKATGISELTVRMLDKVGLASCLNNVCILNLHIVNSSNSPQHLSQRAASRKIYRKSGLSLQDRLLSNCDFTLSNVLQRGGQLTFKA